MIRYALVAFFVLCAVAQAQNLNPRVNDVWGYFGPTLGGGWTTLSERAVTSTYNALGSRPSSTTTAGFSITSNYAGVGEVDYWSTVNSSGDQGHYFYQKLTNTTEQLLASIDGTAALSQFSVLSGTVQSYFGATAGTEGYSGTFSNHPFKLYTNNTLAATFSTGQQLTLAQPLPLGSGGTGGATVPAALQNLGLQIPASCDGFRADNGATTSGSPTFTSATANFLTTDVGKPISIQGAGVNFFVLTVGINAGGAGHAVGDIVSFPGTVSIRVVKVSAGSITEFRVWTVGSSSTSPATLSQSSTTGAGTGAVLDTTWQRENLVTTIAARNSATSVQLAANANATATGLKWGYGTDYSATIIAALGTGVQLPQGICGVRSALAYNGQDTLVGKGSGTNGVPQTTIMWLGAVGGIPVDSGTAGGQISGINLGNYNIDGLCSAATGLRMYRTAFSTVYPTIVENTTQIGFDIDATASAGTQGITMYDPQAGQTHACSSFADGIRWGRGTATNNINHIKIFGGRVNTRHGDGFACYNADTNAVYSLFGQKVGGGTGNSLSLYGSVGAIENCRANDFFASDPLGGSVAYTDTVAAKNNYVEIRQESGSACLTGDAASQNSQLCKPNSNVLQGTLKTGLRDTTPIQTLYRSANANFTRNGLAFSLNDSAGTERTYGLVEGMIVSNTAGAYQGALNFHVSTGGATVERMRLRQTGTLELGTAVGSNATGALLIPNNTPIQGLDTGGTVRNLFSVNSANNTDLWCGSAGCRIFDNWGGSTIGTSDGSGSFTFNNTLTIAPSKGLTVGSDHTSFLVNATTGNVGIGTVTGGVGRAANYPLEINRQRTSADMTLLTLGTNTTAGAVNDKVNILIRGMGTGGAERSLAQIAGLQTSNAVGALTFSTANTDVLTERMRILDSGSVTVNSSLMLGSATPLTLATGEMGLAKITASGSAPGAAGGKLALVCGTNAGTAKVIAYAGTSTTPVTVIDNIGAGVTGC